jgi:hypothetical protein
MDVVLPPNPPHTKFVRDFGRLRCCIIIIEEPRRLRFSGKFEDLFAEDEPPAESPLAFPPLLLESNVSYSAEEE